MPDTAAPQDFTRLLAEYDLALARMQRSHDQLLGKVAELQGELQRKNDLLAHQSRMAMLGEIAAGVAHEIRNPLGGIRLYLDLLEREVKAQGSPTIGKIRGVVARLDRVVRDVLTHSRELHADCQPQALMNVVMEAVGLASLELTGSDVALAVDCAEGTAALDHDLVVRLLLNLVLNAAQAIQQRDDGREGGRVMVRSGRDANGSYFAVEDDGPGIPAEQMQRLFTPFFSKKEGGTGLGLALCRRIAEAHRGELRAANRPEGGARFELRLP